MEYSTNEYGSLKIRTQIVGVTFDNKDGISRQEILSGISLDGFYGDIALQRYTYKGDPAYRVLCDDQIVGNLPAELSAKIAPMDDNGAVIVADDFVVYGGPDEENPEKSYGAALTLKVLSSAESDHIWKRIHEWSDQAKRSRDETPTQTVKKGLSRDEYERAVSTPRKVRKIVLIVLLALAAAGVVFFKIRDVLWSIAW